MSDGNREEVHGPNQQNRAGLRWFLCEEAFICKTHDPDASLSLRIVQRLERMATGVVFACALRTHGMKNSGHFRGGGWHEGMGMGGRCH